MFPPWRETFYPAGLPRARELDYAATKLTSIEINGTYYGSQSPDSFRKWYQQTPPDFVFAVKGPRFATNRKILAGSAESIARFFSSGVLELREKLGPVNWQFAATKKFDAEDFAGFLGNLPREMNGVALRHAVEVRHDSFKHPEFVALAREFGVAAVVAGDSAFPLIADVTAPFVYARIMGTQAAHPAGYAPAAITAWVKRVKAWAAGKPAPGLKSITAAPGNPGGRDVFLYVISGEKRLNPAAALALIAGLGQNAA